MVNGDGKKPTDLAAQAKNNDIQMELVSTVNASLTSWILLGCWFESVARER